ncbi:hypothetical protein TUM4438_09110 [Shewanella sairae]|uniref:Lipoprotein n=1 Tax=Shewanella sairae TaxID=190310 RepID=A0ABQ4P4Q7_9GAMM|nr:hypothetical protein TUM4438_09110 [Shewanella sairae]
MSFSIGINYSAIVAVILLVAACSIKDNEEISSIIVFKGLSMHITNKKAGVICQLNISRIGNRCTIKSN